MYSVTFIMWTKEKTFTVAREDIVFSKNSWDWLRGGVSLVYPKPEYFPPWLGGKSLKIEHLLQLY